MNLNITPLSDFNQVSADLKHYYELVSQLNHDEILLADQPDSFLIERSQDLQKRSLFCSLTDEIMVEAYCLVNEVVKRKLKITPFDVQIIGAIALHKNKVIEMQTGEGKTLTAVFTAYLNALSKKGVHVLTFNDYLAKRDANWMRVVFESLGLTVGYINEGMDKAQKYLAYQCDITYATAKEVGFDYLRSFIAYQPTELMLRPFHFAIIDEADALLIDEARNPLVLAGDLIHTNIDFYRIAGFVGSLLVDIDFGIDDYSRNVFLTESGIEKTEKSFAIENLHSDQHLNLHSAINLSIHARILLQKDVDYVVINGEIKLVDEFTGRIVEDRKWRNGLQTAVEAKEGVKIQSEGNILNAISLQHFICQYPKKSGMTGTVANAAEEFYNFYGMEVFIIPTNKPCLRNDYPDEIFVTKADKTKAIIEEVKHVNSTGQPILIGTLTVKESEELALCFKENNISCQILNAKNNEQEAAIIADAGRKGAVTISTNMAGRGTDILLGGKEGSERAKVIDLGGLYVIGTNRHETIRIDNQLRGRAGRQGDVGSSRFFISLEDELMVKYRLKEALPKKLKNFGDDSHIHDTKVMRFINHIQRVIEGQAYDIRKTLFDYSDFIEKQRAIIQSERQRWIIEPTTLQNLLLSIKIHGWSGNQELVDKVLESILFQYDMLWAKHLDTMQQTREGIHLLRLGGQNPLREFQKKANTGFIEMCLEIDAEIQIITQQILNNPNVCLSDLGIKKPSSTWTYMINDNPFGRQLSIMLLSNVGLQVDIFSAIILGIYGMIKKIKGAPKKKS